MDRRQYLGRERERERERERHLGSKSARDGDGDHERQRLVHHGSEWPPPLCGSSGSVASQRRSIKLLHGLLAVEDQ